MKYKVGDKVRYLENTTCSNAKVGDEYYITKIDKNNKSYSLGIEQGIEEFCMLVGETDIELVEEEFKSGEQVAVSSISIKQAIEDLKIDNFKYYYIGKSINGKYVIENEYGVLDKPKYIAKIPKVIEMTLKEVCDELGRDIKIIK